MGVNIQWVLSPNFTTGRQGYKPIAFVVHIMQGTLADTDSWFRTTSSQVSAHYGVGRSGEIHRYVGEDDTAWHAGRVNAPTWGLLIPGINPNLYTIGIEHEGQTGVPWTPAMYGATSCLMATAANRWDIPLDRQHVIGHHEIYGLKPFCPGVGVDLDRLIDLSRQIVLAPAAYTFVALSGAVTTTTALNIRATVPTTEAPIVRVAAAGASLPYTGWTSNGRVVHGNGHWYRDVDGNYFWAGGTDKPVPQSL